MSTRAEIRQIRLAQWRKIFQEKANSGLTTKDFCAINNISKDAYYYWLKLAREEVLSEVKQPALVELKPPTTPNRTINNPTNATVPELADPHLVVAINGASIKVDSNTPKELFAMVLEVIKNA